MAASTVEMGRRRAMIWGVRGPPPQQRRQLAPTIETPSRMARYERTPGPLITSGYQPVVSP